MPPFPGEDRIHTVFADIHYYFTAPSPRPVQHRFDKGSYLYVYHNATRHSSRLEIANHPGTSDQDAFQGSLDHVKMRYSHQFPTLLTIIVDPEDIAPRSPPSSPGSDGQEWRLASADPRDQGQYKYRLHTLDVYFWTLQDAAAVMEACQKLLRSEQVDILDSPADNSKKERNQQGALSPVVQQLENVAVNDPAYRNGQTRNSQNQASHLPPPPSSAMRGHSAQSAASQDTSPNDRAPSAKSAEAQTDFTPMAYNPAAPAAPEPIAHREKTPPPTDESDGAGFANHGQRRSQPHNSQAYTPAATQSHQPHSEQYTNAGQPHSQRSVSSYTTSASAAGSQHSLTQYHTGYAASPPPPAPQLQQYQPSTGYASAPSVPQAQYQQPPPAVGPPPAQPYGISQPPGGPLTLPSTQTQYGEHHQPEYAAQGYPHHQSHHQPAPSHHSHHQARSSTSHPEHNHQFQQHHDPRYQQQQQHSQQGFYPPGQHPPPPPPASSTGGHSQYPYALQPQPQPQQQYYQQPSVTHQQPYQPQYPQPQTHPHAHNPYDIHSQLYRPSVEEMEREEKERRRRHRQSSGAVHSSTPPHSAAGGSAGGVEGNNSDGRKTGSGRLESTAGKVDKRVGGFLKKLEKKL